MEGEWSLFYEMYSEEADFMAELLSNCTLPSGVDDETPMMHSSNGNTSGGNSNILLPMSSTSDQSYDQSESSQIFGANSSLMAIDYCVVEGKDDGFRVQAMVNDGMYGDEFLNEGIMSSNGIESKSLKLEKETRLAMEDGRGNNSSEMSNKRPWIGGEVQKNKRAMKKKRVSNSDNDNNNNNVVLHKQSSSSCHSEDESNASHELNEGVTSSSNSKGSAKIQSSRGSAMDPQSLYARKRRERINERLRILQNLVPNGTKVDISTMLEEAVQYVKFLQLQIRLLSSDDLWMHAPIAYNGKDIGLDLEIDNIPKLPSGNSRHHSGA